MPTVVNEAESASGRGSCDAAGFRIDLRGLVAADPSAIIGRLSEAVADSGFSQYYTQQVAAWREQVALLQATARDLIANDVGAADWHLLLEYEIPRRQKRPDAVILAGDVIFVIEFKFGAEQFDSAGRWQAEDYALDLRDFHAESSGRVVVPVLCAPQAAAPTSDRPLPDSIVWPVMETNSTTLPQALRLAFNAAHKPSNPAIDAEAWARSPYRPALTIVEAAERLFNSHDVREISHSYADNLGATTSRIVQAACEAQSAGTRTICFVTGVPGAGKTLAGLNSVHDPALRREGRPPSVFLSGNGPLVKIVRAALVANRQRHGAARAASAHEVSTFIQNVHTFLRLYASNPDRTPPEQVVVFDEAQRAWNAEQMARKRGINRSEPEILLEVMSRHQQWCVVVALVGGGQEIHLGEAGLAEWGRALTSQGTPWTVLASPEGLAGGTSVAGHRLFEGKIPRHLNVREAPHLHLGVSVRSPRAQRIAEWVNDVLNLRPDRARGRLADMADFPLVATRSLGQARNWLRGRSRLDPFHRCGLLASSGGLRHRADGLEVSSAFTRGFPFEQWFLAGPGDVRSSYALEVAATEFECQGLELDWAGVCWGDDLALGTDGQWLFRRFLGSRWQQVRNPLHRQYATNKYRVLLTRAREGMLIWVPPGDASDPTRDPACLDRVHNLILAAGAEPA